MNSNRKLWFQTQTYKHVWMECQKMKNEMFFYFWKIIQFEFDWFVKHIYVNVLYVESNGLISHQIPFYYCDDSQRATVNALNKLQAVNVNSCYPTQSLQSHEAFSMWWNISFETMKRSRNNIERCFISSTKPIRSSFQASTCCWIISML